MGVLRAACLATLLTSTALGAENCDLAVVGAGAGGALAAWQAAEAGRRVCVFERSNRPGGRIHSLRGQGPKRDLVVEAGAYRFAPHRVCMFELGWCIQTPITAAIVKALGLSFAVYNPDPKLWDHNMRKLVDGAGQDIGFLTLVEKMLQRATQRGARVVYNTEVTGLAAVTQGNGTAIQLNLANGGDITASAVVLNIPQAPLLRLLRHSGPPFGTTFTNPLHDPVRYPIMKLYVYYEDAWWRNYLNLTAGPFQNNNSMRKNLNIAVPSQGPAPLGGQYHDGDVRCTGGKCSGFLQAFYSADLGAIRFYESVHPHDGESAVQLSMNSAEQRHILKSVHSALLEFHRTALDAVNMTDHVAQMLPDSGVLSIWSESVSGIETGCHMPKWGKHPTPEGLPAEALQPFKGWPVYVANEAFGPVGCFAEGSLNMSTAALESMGVQRPPWLNGSSLALELESPPPPTDPFLVMSASHGVAAAKQLAGSQLVI